jgi:hypothetical protein
MAISNEDVRVDLPDHDQDRLGAEKQHRGSFGTNALLERRRIINVSKCHDLGFMTLHLKPQAPATWTNGRGLSFL